MPGRAMHTILRSTWAPPLTRCGRTWSAVQFGPNPIGSERWQEMHAVRQSCHSWRNRGNRKFPAMLLFLVGLLVLAGVAIAAALRAFRTDGYGRRSSPPRSHAEEYPQWSMR